MFTFIQFLGEYRINDLRYFKALPDDTPPKDVGEIAKRYGVAHMLHFKLIHNKCFTHSREMDDGIIGMVENDSFENWVHETGHFVYDHSDKNKIKPVLDEIRNEYGQLREKGLKWLEIGGYDYSYSHSGPKFEYDELFAISFSFYEGDKEKFDNPSIDKAFQTVLDELQKNPLYDTDPYSQHDSVGPIA